MKAFKTFVGGILAGISIAIGGTVFLSLSDKVLGALFFTVGLFAVCTFGFNLFTGKVCYVFDQDRSYALGLPLIWLGNLAGDELVNGILSHIDVERLITFPRTIDLGKDFHLDGVTFGSTQHLFPFFLIDEHFLSLSIDEFSTWVGQSCHRLSFSFLHRKVQRTDVGRNGHFCVVRINLWKSRLHSCVGWHRKVLSTRCQQSGNRRY